MLKRILSAVVGILLLGYIIKIGGWLFCVSVSFLNICALDELHKAFKNININTKYFLNSILAVGLLSLTNYLHDFNFILVYSFLIIALILHFLNDIINNNSSYLVDVVFSIFSFIYTSVLFMCFILIRNLQNGVYIIWWLFIIIWACDTGAFFTGMFFGKRPLASKISPNKTIEGSLGGILSSIAASLIFSVFVFPKVKIVDALVLGFLIGIVAQLGDLSASLIKRYCKIKDFSNIIPGHGGILDRFDSALFAFPTAYIYIVSILDKGGLP